VLIAAAICPAPPLLARELTGAELVLPELRRACQDAAAGLLTDDPDLVAVVGTAASTRQWDAEDASLDLSPYAPALRQVPGARRGAPLPVGLGCRLLDQAGYRGPRELHTLSPHEPTEACAALGARFAEAADRVALLIMADGSARRGPKAPGYLDERSGPFDAEVERAVQAGDMTALLAIDAGLANDLMATGRPGWQVLAGAMNGKWASTHIRYSDDPFGVAYLVASLTAE
jgi:hypothetical protein